MSDVERMQPILDFLGAPADERERLFDRDFCTYFVQGADTAGPIKIGYSCAVITRLRTLRKEHGDDLELLAHMPGASGMESLLHRRYAEWRVTGEWFRPNPHLSDLIALLSGLGNMLFEQVTPAVGGRIMTLQDVAEYCGVSRTTAHRWVMNGQLNPVEPPKSYLLRQNNLRIYEAELERFLRTLGIEDPKPTSKVRVQN